MFVFCNQAKLKLNNEFQKRLQMAKQFYSLDVRWNFYLLLRIPPKHPILIRPLVVNPTFLNFLLAVCLHGCYFLQYQRTSFAVC